MASIQQIVKEIRKSLSNYDLEKGIELSDNEAKTRMYLVEPFFECLRFLKLGHTLHIDPLKTSFQMSVDPDH